MDWISDRSRRQGSPSEQVARPRDRLRSRFRRSRVTILSCQRSADKMRLMCGTSPIPLIDAGLVKSWSCTSCAFIPISLRTFPPLAKGGLGGAGPGTTSHKVFPCSLPLSPFASLSRGQKNRFRFPRLSHHPPCPPFARGGKGSLAHDVIPSRATKTRVSTSSLQLCQHQLFTGPPSF